MNEGYKVLAGDAGLAPPTDGRNWFCRIQDQAYELFEWLEDHLHRKNVLLLLSAVFFVYLTATHLEFCVELWERCTQICESLGGLSTVPVALLCIMLTLCGIPVDLLLVWSGALYESMYGPVLGTTVAIAASCVGVYI